MPKENFEHGRNSEKEGKVPLARAILARGLHENMALRKATVAETGVLIETPQFPATEDQGIRAVDRLLELQGKGPQKKFFSALVDELDPEACRQHVRSLFSPGDRDTVTPENAKKHLQVTAATHGEMYPDIFDSIDLIVRFKPKAEEISEREGVTPDVVYLNNKLFGSLMVESTSPEDLAKENVDYLKTFTADKMRQIRYDTLRSTLGLFVEGTPEDLDSTVKEVLAKHWANTENDAQELKDNVKVYTKNTINTYWGEEAFDQLDPKLRRELDRDKDPRDD